METVVAGTSTALSLFALAACAELKPEVTGYGSLCAIVGGRAAGTFVDFVLGVFMTLILGGSFIVVRDEFRLVYDHDPFAVGCATMAVAALVVLLALPKSIDRMTHAATFSVASFCFLVFTLMYYGISELTSGSGMRAAQGLWWPAHDGRAGTGSSSEGVAALVVFPAVLYGFGCQIQIIDIYRGTAQGPRPGAGGARLRNFLPVVASSCSAMLLLFSAVGVFGVLCFPGQKIPGDVLTLMSRKGQLGQVAKVVLVVAVVSAAPLIVYPARAMLRRSVSQVLCSSGSADVDVDGCVGRFAHILWTASIVAASASVALSGVDFMLATGAMGAFLGAPLFFVVPGACLIVLVRNAGGQNGVICRGALKWSGQAMPSPGALETGLLADDTETLGSDTASAAEAEERAADWLERSRAARAWLLAAGCWLVVFGAATTALSLWVYFDPNVPKA
jgi:hypothetical protein